MLLTETVFLAVGVILLLEHLVLVATASVKLVREVIKTYLLIKQIGKSRKPKKKKS